jgi:hypothetical protein
MKRDAVDAKKEVPSLFCNVCRTWVVSQERVNMFATVDGVAVHIGVWTCPPCRGEVGAPSAPVSPEITTQAAIAQDERLGPYRELVRTILNESGKSARATLSCGHTVGVFIGAKKARCRKCRGGAAES